MADVENSFRDCISGAIPGCPSGTIAIPYLRMVQKLVTENGQHFVLLPIGIPPPKN